MFRLRPVTPAAFRVFNLRIESPLGLDYCQAMEAVWRRSWDALNGPTWVEARVAEAQRTP
jgi:hypothetical protein